MLSISRKEGQSLHLINKNNEVIATIKIQPQRRHNQTSLGINFSTDFKVVRDEKLAEMLESSRYE